MADSLRQVTKGLVSFKVLSDGNELPGSTKFLLLNVYKEINKVSTAVIHVKDGGFGDDEGFDVSDSEAFGVGKEIEITAGYDFQEETIFKGIVTRYGMRMRRGDFFLEIECKDPAIKSTLGKKNNVYEAMVDSDIISDALSDYSDLSVNVESTSYEHPVLYRSYISDWDFVVQRAEANSMYLVNSDGEIDIKKPAAGSAVLKIEPNDSVISFNVFHDSKNIFSGVKSVGWDMDNQEVVEAASNPPENNECGSISSDDLAGVLGVDEVSLGTSGTVPMELLTEWATAQHTKAEWSKIRGKIVISGYNKIKPGDTIEIDGFSDQFAGNVLVSSVEHTLENGSYTTELGIGLSPQWFSEGRLALNTSPVASLIPPVNALQVGVVEQIHEDENGQYRIKVQLPTLQSDLFSVWARLSTLYATVEAGIYFYPEIGDEVIVGFLNDDPLNAVILGSVHNKVNLPPEEPTEDNFIKAIVTKEQLKISFDDENKAIIIETPEGNIVTMNDTDGIISIVDMNENSIEMSADGIVVNSAADLIFNAEGNIELNANADIAAVATGDASMEGVNVNQVASAKFAAEGANVELNGSAQTVVKGGVVMIN